MRSYGVDLLAAVLLSHVAHAPVVVLVAVVVVIVAIVEIGRAHV